MSAPEKPPVVSRKRNKKAEPERNHYHGQCSACSEDTFGGPNHDNCARKCNGFDLNRPYSGPDACSEPCPCDCSAELTNNERAWLRKLMRGAR